MTKNTARDLRLVGKTSPNSLGLKLHIKKALTRADAREYAILGHENFHKDIKGVIRDRFLIPLAIELALGKKEKYALIWNIPEVEILSSQYKLETIGSPEGWITGDSKILYDMCIADGVPVVAYVQFSGRLKTRKVYLAIDIERLKSQFKVG